MIYLMSDIHGQYDRYVKMLEKISFNENDKLYVLGDAIDRGPDSLETLLDIMERDNVEMFLGNHEHMMLTFLDGSDRESWFYGVNGGRITYEQFMSLDKGMQNKVVDYLLYHTTLKKDLNFDKVRYILSHTSAIDNGIDMYMKDYANDLMAIQDFIWNQGRFNIDSIPNLPNVEKETVFISGHIITRRLKDDDEIFAMSFHNNYSWIDIDCGCAMGSDEYGYLSTLAINDEGDIESIHYIR